MSVKSSAFFRVIRVAQLSARSNGTACPQELERQLD